MSEVTNLTIEASDGSVFTTERHELQATRLTPEQRAERAPFSEAYFLVGDGMRNVEPVEFTIHLRDSTLRSAVDALKDLKAVLTLATTIRWGEYHRPILGLRSVVPQQVLLGYRVDITLWPSGPSWLDENDEEVTL